MYLHGEISGLRWRTSSVVIRRHVPIITASSIIMVPNYDTPAKYIGEFIFQEKKHFSRVLQGDRKEGVLDNFVERVRFYHNLAVHDG